MSTVHDWFAQGCRKVSQNVFFGLARLLQLRQSTTARRVSGFLQLFNTERDQMINAMKKFWNEEDGATAVEYGIMVAAIAAVIITVVISIGTKVDTAMDTVDTGLTTAAN